LICQVLEISRELGSGKSQREVMASYGIRSSAVYNIKKRKGQLQCFMASGEGVKDLLE
jgi:hypothetical protein